MITKRNTALFALIALLLVVSEAKAQETKLTWWGHAAFSITTPKGKVLLIDPWLSNPSNPVWTELRPLPPLTNARQAIAFRTPLTYGSHVFTFIESSIFERVCPAYLDDDEYSELQRFLMQNPNVGELIPG